MRDERPGERASIVAPLGKGRSERVDRNQRRHKRVQCIGTADVYLTPTGQAQTARIQDLSLEGSLLALGTAPAPEQGASVEIAFTVNQIPFRVRAIVRAIRPNRMIGVEFDLISERTRVRLQDLILELEEESDKVELSRRQALKVRKATEGMIQSGEVDL